MSFAQQKKWFENNKKIYESVLLTFDGVEGYDVYNPSIPFLFNGKKYIFGRIERREQWSRSWVRLFEETGRDQYCVAPNSMIYQLEDPYIAMIDGQLVFGGVHPRFVSGQLDTYQSYFYKGTDINDLYYFTTGPDYMKDIRLVQLEQGRIGVFSRPRSEAVRAKYGSEAVVGFTIINSLEDLRPEVIENAPVIEDLFVKDEWGGCNQCYLLESGNIGVIGHRCYKEVLNGGAHLLVYVNTAFVIDPVKNTCLDMKIIGTRSCYPACPAKTPDLVDCVFSSGIIMREDGKADLYSGVCDVAAGRITIDYPFESYGGISTASGVGRV